MKAILAVVLSLLFLSASAQNDTSKYIQYRYLYGNWTDRIRVDKVLTPPVDTTFSKVGIALRNGIFYTGNGSYWSSGAVDVIDLNSLKRSGKLYSKVPVLKSLTEMRGIATADLDTGFVYKLNRNGEFYYDPNDVSSADDSAMVIVTSGGKRLKRATNGVLTPRMFGAKGDGVTDDWWAFQKLWNWIGAHSSVGWSVDLEGMSYLVNHEVKLPQNLFDGGQVRIDVNGRGATINTTAAITMFSRVPINDAVAQPLISNWVLSWHHTKFQGSGIAGQVGMDFGACFSWDINHNEYNSLDTCMKARFWLQSFFQNNKTTNCLSIGYWQHWGDWSGGTLSGDACNGNVVEGNRFYMPYTAAHSGLSFFGGNQNMVRDNIVEGNKPVYELEWDYSGSNNSTLNTIEHFYSECIAGSISVNTLFKLRMGGTMRVSGVTTIYPSVFFDLDNSQSASFLDIDNFNYYQTADTTFSARGASTYGIHIGRTSQSLFTLMDNINNWKSLIQPSIGFVGTNQFGLSLNTTNGTAVGVNRGLDVGIKGGQTTVRNLASFYNSVYLNGYTYALSNVFIGQGSSIVFQLAGGFNLTTMNSFTSDSSWNLQHASLNTKWDKNGKWNFNATDNSFLADSTFKFNGSGHFTAPVAFDQRSGYSTYTDPATLGPNDFIPKQALTDAIAGIPTPPAQIVVHDSTLTGSGTTADSLRVSPIKYYNRTQVDSIANAIAVGSGYLDTVAHNSTLKGRGTVAVPLSWDSAGLTYTKYRIDSLAAAGSVAPDGSETKVHSGSGATVTGIGTIGNPYIISLSSTAGNQWNALNFVAYGAVANSTTTGSKNANVAAFNNMTSDEADGQICIIPNGDFYFNNNLVVNSYTKKVFIQQLGNLHFDAGYGVIIEGVDHNWIATGNCVGGNSGASDSLHFAAYTGDGYYLRNCYNCNLSVNKVSGFYSDIKVGGESSTIPKGAQYNKISYQWLSDAYAMIYVTTTGTTDGTQGGDLGNWSNSNWFYGGEIGGPGNGQHGTYGILQRKGATSNQRGANRFNYNHFINSGIEGALYAVWMNFSEWCYIGPGRWEAPQITHKIFLQEDNTSGFATFNIDISDMEGVYESFFEPSGKGQSTKMPKMLNVNFTPTGDVFWPNGSGGLTAVVGKEPSTRASSFDMLSLSNFGGIKDQRYGFHVIRATGTVDDYMSLDGKSTTQTGNYTVATNIRRVYCNPSGSQTITLPAAASYPDGNGIWVKNIHASTSVTVSGPAAGNTTTLAPGQAAHYFSDGTSWRDNNQQAAGSAPWGSATPTVTVGALAGTGATATIAGTNSAGTITVTTGTGGSGSYVFRINFGSANGTSTSPRTVFFPASYSAASLMQTQFPYATVYATNVVEFDVSGLTTGGAIYTFNYVAYP